MKIVVVGGGLLGLGVGYRLSQSGATVTVLEASDQLGGLAADVDVAGIQVDRFYHCILNSDDSLLGLINDVGLSDQLRMRPVKAGFFHNARTYSISTPLDILRFPPLNPLDRLRLVRSLLECRRLKDWQALEDIDVETWLRQLSGNRVFETVWRPLLSAKFDGDFANTPATYIWSRTVRTTDTRSAGGRKELAGHLVGGYRTLAERLAERIRAAGGDVRTDTPVTRIVTESGRVAAIEAGPERFEADRAILTVPLPLAARLLRSRAAHGLETLEHSQAIDAYTQQVEDIEGYLGVICVLLVLKRSLSPYYTLYLADGTLPFTAVIESTNIIDPALVGGRHLVYLPKYVDPASEVFQRSDDEIRDWFVSHLRTIHPDLQDDDIVAAPIFRAPHVEPLHPIGSFGTVPPLRSPIEGLFVGSTKHFYPRLNNGDAVMHLAETLAAEAAEATAEHRQRAPHAELLATIS